MPKRQDFKEEWAINILQKIINESIKNRDAFPGSSIKLIKKAQVIMKKRRKS
jgi:hypothetical protein